MLYVTSVWFYTIFVFHHGPWVEVFQTICWIRISLSRTELRGKWCHVNSWEYKRKKQNFACFDLIRCVLSLSYKTEILVRTQVWPEFFFRFFSIYSFWCPFGLYLNKKIPPQHPPSFLQFNPKVLFVWRVSTWPLRLSEKLFEKGTNSLPVDRCMNKIKIASWGCLVVWAIKHPQCMTQSISDPIMILITYGFQ